MLERIKNNFPSIKDGFVSISGVILGVATLFLSFLSWEDLGVEKSYIKILILILLMILSGIIAIASCLRKNEKNIFGDNNKGVDIRYGDLMNLAFPENNVEDRIIVIPVNRCFDVSFEQNLISEKSLHGKWLKRYIVSEEQRSYVNDAIQESLRKDNDVYTNISCQDKKVGNLKRYVPGTVAEMLGANGVKFYLLAVAWLDNNLNARCTEEEFYKAIQGLINYYDANGQAKDIYIPIMGDHIIRPTRDTKDIMSLIVSMFKFNRQNVHGKVHIVVYSKMKNTTSILDF